MSDMNIREGRVDAVLDAQALPLLPGRLQIVGKACQRNNFGGHPLNRGQLWEVVVSHCGYFAVAATILARICDFDGAPHSQTPGLP